MPADSPGGASDRPGPPDLMARLGDPDPRKRLDALEAFGSEPLPRAETWARALLTHVGSEPSDDVRHAALALLGRPDAAGRYPLEVVLDSVGGAARKDLGKTLVHSLESPQLFSRAFAGLLDAQCRTLAGALGELASTSLARVRSTLESCLYIRDAHVQSVGLVGLLEVPEEVALPILTAFPDELAVGRAQDFFREVRSTFEFRRFFRDRAIPYFPLRCLGEGGMGAVYLSRDLKRPPRLAALKFMRPGPDGSLGSDLRSRFEREARVPFLLNHPGLVRVSDFSVDSTVPWIDVDFIHGGTLQAILERSGRLSWERARWIVLQVADALDYLRRRRIVHRDLKPANLFVASDPQRVILGDFGLVLIQDEVLQTEVPNYIETQAHVILGSPGYMAPEQATGGAVDHRSDLFSLGVVLYEMLEGQLPFACSTFSEYVGAVTAGRPLPRLEAAVPAQVEGILARLLAREPSRRFATAAEVVAALEQAGDARPRAPGAPESAQGVARPPGAGPASKAGTMVARRDPDTAARPARTEVVEGPASPPGTGTEIVSRPDPVTSGESPAPARAAPSPDPAPASRDPTMEMLRGVVARSPETAEKPQREAPSPPETAASAPAAGGPGRRPTPMRTASLRVSASGGPAPARHPDKDSSAGRGGFRGFFVWSGGGQRGVCLSCNQPLDDPVVGCSACRRKAMPLCPWALHWALFAVSAALFLPLVLGKLGVSVPVPVILPESTAFALSLGTFLLARGLGQSYAWAYVVVILPIAVVAVVGVAVTSAVALMPFHDVPPAIKSIMSLLGPMAGRGLVPPDVVYVTIKRFYMPQVGGVAALAVLLAYSLLGEDSRRQYLRHWSWSAIVLIPATIVLLAWPLMSPAAFGVLGLMPGQ